MQDSQGMIVLAPSDVESTATVRPRDCSLAWQTWQAICEGQVLRSWFKGWSYMTANRVIYCQGSFAEHQAGAPSQAGIHSRHQMQL